MLSERGSLLRIGFSRQRPTRVKFISQQIRKNGYFGLKDIDIWTFDERKNVICSDSSDFFPTTLMAHLWGEVVRSVRRSKIPPSNLRESRTAILLTCADASTQRF
ncbi:hypothetical protein AVEN_177509-1 [Araneus ventricosus]|uniref:Uncharacterized protein n=1 Tax=Araneus ventricosus TaxID=182803 RepID=A0A4Y2D2B8_ARAVE|nr:hypothetical protein AVEN_177509-1 [Araneus ventricosus]